MVLKVTDDDRRHLAHCHDEFRGPRSGLCRSGGARALHLYFPSSNLTREHTARWLFRVPSLRKGTIQTSMPSPGFELRSYGTAASLANHCTGWASHDLSGVASQEGMFKNLGSGAIESLKTTPLTDWEMDSGAALEPEKVHDLTDLHKIPLCKFQSNRVTEIAIASHYETTPLERNDHFERKAEGLGNTYTISSNDIDSIAAGQPLAMIPNSVRSFESN
ncbi:hypothetical protein TNCV_1135381 [Trichonephila clavipes]|nr:hypothetical protein TNCV_1135381 [Trichonephila clavipes]